MRELEEPVSGREALLSLEAQAEKRAVEGLGRRVTWRRWGREVSAGEGSDAPLVLFHGGHGSWRHWARNIEALSRRHTLWLPDLPGFGDSDDIGLEAHAPDRLPRLVDIVVDSANRLFGEATPLCLGGFSFGGLVAAHFAARRGHVERLALLGSAGHRSTRRQREPMSDWRVDDRAERLAALHQNLRSLMFFDASRIDDVAMAIHEQSCELTRFRSKSVSLAGSLADTLRDFHAPLLAIWGRHDVTATVEQAAALLCEGHSERAWRIVEDAGHWVQYEQSDAVNALLAEWFWPHGSLNTFTIPPALR